MQSSFWEDDEFTRKYEEISRRKLVHRNFLRVVLDLIAFIWLAYFSNPSDLLNLRRYSVESLILQIPLQIALIVVLLSLLRDTYYLLVTSNLFGVRKPQAGPNVSINVSVSEDKCGPSIFKKSVPYESFLSTYLSPTKSPLGEQHTPPISTKRHSWHNGQSPFLLPNPQIPPPLDVSAATHVEDRSWTSSSVLGSPPSPSRTSFAQWASRSPSSAGALATPLKYQLSHSKDSPNSNLAVGNSETMSQRRLAEAALEALYAEMPEVPAGREGARKRQSLVDAPEKDAAEYWKTHNVSDSCLRRWTQNMQRWLHGTVLRRVVDEINAVNLQMTQSCEDAASIGAVTLKTLEHLARTQFKHIPTLPRLVRFLDVTNEQGYLVHRLQELARGSYLADYNWDAGSKSIALPWKHHLPNDTMILLHLFSAYMDSILPQHVSCINSGGVFGHLHLVRSPDRPDLKSKYDAQLYVTAVQPPEIKVVIDGVVYKFTPGLNNLFHALLMFFHFYKTLDGEIRGISLGPAGLNAAWVFQQI